MKTSESIKSISKAFAKVQGELKDLFKSVQGYGYKYASLDAVLKEIREKNEKHGLSFLQDISVEGEEIVVETTLLHESGEYFQFKSSLPFTRLKGMNDYQSAGSGFTYARRYVLSAIFGIASDEDTDAHGEQQNKQQPQKTQQKQQNTFRKEVLRLANTEQKQNTVRSMLNALGIKKLEELKEEQKAPFIEELKERIK